MEITIKNAPHKGWNKFAHHPLQTTMFGAYNYDQNGCVPQFLRVKHDDLTVAQLLYFIKGKGAEFFMNFPLGKTLGKISKKFFPVICWYQGPTILSEKVNKKLILKEIIKKVKEVHNINKIEAEGSEVFEDSINVWATYKIHLIKSEDVLWSGIKKSTRKNIKKAKEKYRVVIDNDDKTIVDYLKLLRQSRKELGMKHLPPVFVNQTMIDLFNNKAQIVLAYENEKPIAGMGIIRHEDELLEIGSAIPHRVGNYVGDLIKWNIILYGKMNWCKWYDLGGVNPLPSSEKEENIRRFKEKFGGEYFEYSIIK